MKRIPFGFATALTVFYAASSSSNAAGYLVCNVEHIFERSYNGTTSVGIKENLVLSIRIDTPTINSGGSVSINSNKSGSETVYSDYVCKSNKNYSSWMTLWKKDPKNKSDGCASSLNATTDTYDGFISLDAGFLSAYQEVRSLRINRITGSYQEDITMWVPPGGNGGLRHITKGVCEKSAQKF